MLNCTISTLCTTITAYAAALPQLCPGSLVSGLRCAPGSAAGGKLLFMLVMHYCQLMAIQVVKICNQ